MRVEEFNYPLPEELIARYPSHRRDESRLMVLCRKSGNIEHRRFAHIVEYLREGDLLVLNDSRVIPARLKGRKPTGGAVEILAVREIEGGRWLCMAAPAKGLKEGTGVSVGDGFHATIEKVEGEGFFVVEFSMPLKEALDRYGEVPLPPYIRRAPEPIDRERYQTIFARHDGSVAAPTAGLHFTEAVLEGLKDRGVEIHTITLHTGPGTFLPVRVERVEEHRLYPEHYRVEKEVYHAIARAKAEGRRVVAVGTTVTRTLESLFLQERPELEGETELFIYPGYRFRVVSAMVTNFHLPGSTLMMLVCAFAGRDNIMRAYQIAVKERYRFYSYGDAMFII